MGCRLEKIDGAMESHSEVLISATCIQSLFSRIGLRLFNV